MSTIAVALAMLISGIFVDDDPAGTTEYQLSRPQHFYVEICAGIGWFEIKCNDDRFGIDWPVTEAISGCAVADLTPLPTWNCTQTRIDNSICRAADLNEQVPRFPDCKKMLNLQFLDIFKIWRQEGRTELRNRRDPVETVD